LTKEAQNQPIFIQLQAHLKDKEPS